MRRYFLPFLLAVVLIAVALRGGSYDEVPRGETFFAVWWVLGLGAAFGLLPAVKLSRWASVAVGALLALAAWTALGALWSSSVGRTLHEASRTLGYVGVLLLVARAFGPRGWRGAAVSLTVTAVTICFLALASRLLPSLSGELERSGYDTRRLNYPFNYWNALGTWAAMTIGLALAWSAHAPRWWWRALAIEGACVAVPVCYLTYSRSGAVGAVVAAVTVVALSRHRWLAAVHTLVAVAGSAVVIVTIRANPEIAEATGYKGAGEVALAVAVVLVACAVAAYLTSLLGIERMRMAPRAARVAVALCGAAVLVGGVAVGPALAQDAWDSFHRTGGTAGTTGDPAQRLTSLSGERRQLWQAALDAFDRHPLEGAGAGTYEFIWNRDERWSHHVRDAHSLYFETLAELGLPGALLLVVGLSGLVLAAVRLTVSQADPISAGAAAGCSAAFLTFCVTAGVDWMWESTAVGCAAFAAAGVAVAGGSKAVERTSVLPRVAMTVLALVVLGLRTPILVAAAEVNSSQTAVREGRIEDAVAAAAVAVQAEPWSPDGYLQRALVLERKGYLDAAAKDARSAVAKERLNAETWLILARIEVERGRTKAAIAAATRARELNPRNPTFRRPE
jgi:tetratricopeptide (TPR) repeat protein